MAENQKQTIFISKNGIDSKYETCFTTTISIWLALKLLYNGKENARSLIFVDHHEENLFKLFNVFWGEGNRAEDGENGADDGENGAAEDPLSFSNNMPMNVLKKAELDRRCLHLKVQEAKQRLQRTLLVE
ncbi:hypothetical protein TSUD_160450 [Trifolium subterraneum]|uniref:Uncharacterized protein n=1 Tax=Trifolium subterraneum TaxID=3900 RepID=A0A2Z6MS12_TRISU|nr:hypothetical protein TSUD_160450 [Trifolium subterraneum]